MAVMARRWGDFTSVFYTAAKRAPAGGDTIMRSGRPSDRQLVPRARSAPPAGEVATEPKTVLAVGDPAVAEADLQHVNNFVRIGTNSDGNILKCLHLQGNGVVLQAITWRPIRLTLATYVTYDANRDRGVLTDSRRSHAIRL